MTALEILTKRLIGTFISRFSIGDTWDLIFGDYYIVSQNVILEDEDRLTQLLKDKFSWFKNSGDQENIGKCTIVTAYMRKEVTGVKLNESCDLIIEFEGDMKLIIPTTMSIVDWQWCLNKTGKTPYEDYIVACFEKGEILHKEDHN